MIYLIQDTSDDTFALAYKDEKSLRYSSFVRAEIFLSLYHDYSTSDFKNHLDDMWLDFAISEYSDMDDFRSTVHDKHPEMFL